MTEGSKRCNLRLEEKQMSETYSHKMPQILATQPVSSKRNLQVVHNFENM